jgi:DNA polymerase-3 subunit gamma/tau
VSNSSGYIPFARKYRPKSFKDLIGQEVLVKVLSYEIEQDTISSSFVFTGIRGVGKTTSARIIAQTINCSEKKIQDGFIGPCGYCNNCQAFINQAHPDILEVDGASYTSVDNIRDIIEQALYRPVLAKYKVFIIDEVHMLSKSAFNALLKTLEEPPPSVIFMLLTTELSKVPLTILSRCQKFNLKRLSIAALMSVLEHICSQEKINYELAALQSIAYKADGSARDATTILEQTFFLAKQKEGIIDAEAVKESLSLGYFNYAISLLGLILQKDDAKCLNFIAEIHQENCDFLEIVSAMLELIALLCKLKLVATYPIGFFSAYQEDVQRLLASSDLGFLTSLWQILSKGLPELGNSHNQLINFEMLMIKALYCSLIPTPCQLMTAATTSQPATLAPASVKQIKHEAKIPAAIIPPLQNIAATDEPAINDEQDIFEFIGYIHKQHLLELYHFMMNECEISSFGANIIKIVGEKFSQQLQNSLAEALSQWSGAQWQVIHNKKASFKSLQNQLKAEAMLSDEFKMIDSKFPKTQISDVWFNFLTK